MLNERSYQPSHFDFFLVGFYDLCFYFNNLFQFVDINIIVLLKLLLKLLIFKLVKPKASPQKLQPAPRKTPRAALQHLSIDPPKIFHKIAPFWNRKKLDGRISNLSGVKFLARMFMQDNVTFDAIVVVTITTKFARQLHLVIVAKFCEWKKKKLLE